MKIESRPRAAKWQRVLRAGELRDLVTIVGRALPRGGRAVLAVSGGVDSMCLLDAAAAARTTRRCELVVATFDHASGPHSSRAAAFVSEAAAKHGLAAVIGRSGRGARTELAWREARWEFLRSVSERVEGPVLTAHNRDDQIETVLMRALRGAGARGLAGLQAPTSVRRPLLDVSRTELRSYADARRIEWIEDPTNRSLHYLRNRVRLEILPALLQARPPLGAELLELADRAATWRRELAELIDSAVEHRARYDPNGARSLCIRIADLRELSAEALHVVWPELAARIGVILDRRGTIRAAGLIRDGKTSSRVQLSGGWELSRSREWVELRPASPPLVESGAPSRLVAPMTWGHWRFMSEALSPARGDSGDTERKDAGDVDRWRASFPHEAELWIRSWRPGDQMSVWRGNQLARRKVKYFLSDARISGYIRAGWPVVLAGDEIVWIPGVRRSDAAAARSGGPVVTYVCDYLDRRP